MAHNAATASIHSFGSMPMNPSIPAAIRQTKATSQPIEKTGAFHSQVIGVVLSQPHGRARALDAVVLGPAVQTHSLCQPIDNTLTRVSDRSKKVIESGGEMNLDGMIVLSQGEVRPGVLQGQHWGRPAQTHDEWIREMAMSTTAPPEIISVTTIPLSHTHHLDEYATRPEWIETVEY